MKHTIVILVLSLFLASCVQGVAIRPERMPEPSEISGNYRVILYGIRHSDDLDGIVLLDVEGDDYELVPRTPKFDYKLRRNVRAKDALAMASRFLSVYRPLRRVYYRRIIEPGGRTVGYEIRPHFIPRLNDEGTLYRASYHMYPDGKVHVRFSGNSERDSRLIIFAP